MNRIIGIPSNGTELSDNISPHFGHCRYFIGVKINNNKSIERIFTLFNESHNGCMEPVMNMKRQNVTDMILIGIGMRPFMEFQHVNINLYQGVNTSIEENIKLFIQQKLGPMGQASCGNNSNNSHTH
ncbi:MAG: NifB/NifX family molybdenum-iron cluster-binding protein [Promethearchaeota archaeon]